MDVRFKLASNIVIVGPSQAGKTTFVNELIKHRDILFNPKPERVLWCNGNGVENSLATLNINGLPPLDLIKPYDMIVLDDLFLEASESQSVSKLFTKYAHHKPCCVVFLTQNLFYQSKQQRNRALNTHYLILFKNPRDSTAIQYISHQMGTKVLKEIFREATLKPHSYLLIDFHQSTPDEIRFRTNVLPSEYPPTVYVVNK